MKALWCVRVGLPGHALQVPLQLPCRPQQANLDFAHSHSVPACMTALHLRGSQMRRPTPHRALAGSQTASNQTNLTSRVGILARPSADCQPTRNWGVKRLLMLGLAAGSCNAIWAPGSQKVGKRWHMCSTFNSTKGEEMPGRSTDRQGMGLTSRQCIICTAADAVARAVVLQNGLQDRQRSA